MLRKLLINILSCMVLLVVATRSSYALVDDVRIVIDISGSMVKTDPHNLRQSALRMMSGLIPGGSRAGVWTFGRYTNMEVKWGTVDERWRKSAENGARAIHSRGQFTNIEGAIIRASNGWDSPDPEFRRNLILLTDGKIDVGKDPNLNAASRAALLSETIPKLVKNGVNVHTIALSQFTDEILLKRIAYETGGSFEIAKNAEQLQRVFLKMFERATIPDMVPLSDNRFPIDGSVSEMTLLVFNKSDKKTSLITPAKKSYSFAEHASNVKWRNDEGYDLITVSNPAAGEWLLDADVDPDNRVMVITDLQLVVDDIPAYLTPQQAIDLKVELHNKGKKISKNSFLKFVDFNIVHQFGDSTEKIPLALKKSRDIKDKGIYLQTIDSPLQEGQHEVVIHADGSTFSRSKKFNIKVYWPVTVDVIETDEAGVYNVDIIPRLEYIKPESVELTLSLKQPDEVVEPLLIEPNAEGWRSVIKATKQQGTHQLLVSVKASSHDGSNQLYELAPYSVEGVKHIPEEPEQLDAALDDSSEVMVKTEAQTEDRGSDMLFNIMIVAVVNVILIVTGLGIFWYLRKSKSNQLVNLLEDEKNAGEAPGDELGVKIDD